VDSSASGRDAVVRATGLFAPLTGALIGALGGAVYWLSAEIWPSSVAVILSMSATGLLTGRVRGALPATRLDVMIAILCLLTKYNALMGLSAAKLPFAVPANVPLGLIMICGYAASFALPVSVAAARPAGTTPRSHGGAALAALIIGFAPASLLGIPGLIGLAAAVVTALVLILFLKFKRGAAADDAFDMTQLLTEAGFYLGALASWRFV
jgi:cobalamin synthase